MTTHLNAEIPGLTVVLPAFNEAGAMSRTLADLKAVMPKLPASSEILVVDDGSTDETASLAGASGVRVISHPMNSGYGQSLLSGIDAARHDVIAIIDADGTYPADKLPELLARYAKGFHMVVAARQGRHYEGSFAKRILRILFRWLAEYTCGQKIPDINSGFRVFDRRPLAEWRKSLSTGFSFTTSITLLFMLNNRFVGYLPMAYSERVGQSKVKMLRDSLRSLQIILTIIAQFNPLKLYLLLLLANAAGNAGLAFCPRPLVAILGWNTACLIVALGIISVGLLKPSSVKPSDH